MEQAGLVGLVKRAAAHAQGRRRVDPLVWIVRLVFAAGAMYIYMHSGAPVPAWMGIAAALVLGIAALAFEYLASHNVVRAWHERSVGGIVCWSMIWIGAFAYGSNAWLGAASEGQESKAGLAKAAYYTSQDATSEVDRARGKVVTYKAERDRIHQERWAPLPTVAGNAVGSGSEARELLKGYESNTRFYAQLTKQCTETRGPETRAFCKSYAEAKAAVAASDARETKALALEAAEKNLAVAEAALAEARARADITPTVTSDKRADLGILVRYSHMSERTAMDVQAMLKVAVISLFISLTGFLMAMEEYRNKPRRQWPLVARLKRLIYGKDASDPVYAGRDATTTVVEHRTTIDGRPSELLKLLASRQGATA